MKRVGTIKEIWRYPVKGMAGETMESCKMRPGGIVGDRVWALRDVLRDEIQSCKFRPQLLSCTARSSGDSESLGVEVEFPDGDVIASDAPSIHQRLSEVVCNESKLEQLGELGGPNLFKRYKSGARNWLDELKETFARDPGEAAPDFSEFPQEAQDFVTMPGTFFLVSSFHIITSATMDFLKEELPEADWDIRRFRPNIVIETAADAEGLVEQGWIGKRLTIGGLKIDCTGTAIRCGAVVRAQKGIVEDKRMLRTIVKAADQNLGIYGNISGEGMISVGDEVFL